MQADYLPRVLYTWYRNWRIITTKIDVKNQPEDGYHVDCDRGVACSCCVLARADYARKERKSAMKRMLYQALSARTGKELPWGTLTGIRPVRIPIPIAQSAEMGAQNILIQNMGNAGSAYDLNLQCKIIFELDQQQIARSIRYEGKAC